MNTYKEHIKPVVVLTVICIIVAGLLALTNSLTLPIIEKAAIEAANETRRQVLPAGTDFEQVECDVEGVISVYKDKGGAGYVIEAKAKGNNADVVAMVGINADGTVAAVAISSHSEDQGIGTKAFEKSYLDKFVGISGSTAGVDTVSGATHSSTAVINIVSIALEAYKGVAK